jgi:uracil-DNA glycosylase
MNIKKMAISAVLLIIGLPVVLVLMVLVSVSILDRTNGSIVSSGEKREYVLYVPHSSPRNNIWLRHNSWFEEEILTALRRRVSAVLAP